MVIEMARTKHPRTVKILVAVVIIIASTLVIIANWQSIVPAKYPIALSGIIFPMDKQIESVSIGIKTGNANEPIYTNWITINTTGLEPLATPQNIVQGGKYATSDYITPTVYSIGQTVLIERVSNVTQIHEQVTITITSKMLQYTAGYYVNMQPTPNEYAITTPTDAEWSPIP